MNQGTTTIVPPTNPTTNANSRTISPSISSNSLTPSIPDVNVNNNTNATALAPKTLTRRATARTNTSTSANAGQDPSDFFKNLLNAKK